MFARSLLPRASLALAAVVVLVAATLSVSAPAKKDKPLPADETASPAIDPAKLAGSKVLQVKDAANRITSSNNLKQIGIAFHNFASNNASQLPTDILSKDDKQLLSWRVRILPDVGEKALFAKFKLNEPWDSKNNLALLEKMPKVFSSPRVTLKQKGYTVYQVFSGPEALFNKGKTVYLIGNIPDGTSNTIGAVEATKAVPWTKPADLPFDKDKALPDFGKAYDNKPLAGMMDGSVRTLDLKKISATTLKNAIMPADGNVLGEDW